MGLDAMTGVLGVQVAAVGAAWALGAREAWLRRYLGLLVSTAVGVLMATAILHLMPEAVAQLGNRQGVWLVVGGTMLALFCVERIFQAATGAAADEVLTAADGHRHGVSLGTPHGIVFASMLHSFVDGTAVAAGFLAGIRLGWLTAFAIALHEIPHRMGDYALFVHLRVSARRALLLAALAGAPSLLGVALVAMLGLTGSGRIAWLLPVSAGSFLYIACVNLIPELPRELMPRAVALQILSLCAGVVLVMLAAGLFPD